MSHLEHEGFGDWKQVPGIEASMLLVSSEGWVRVRTKSKGGCQSLGLPQKGSLSGTGTRRVGVDGTTSLVHRLVALAFLGQPPSDSHTVDHLNQNPEDNRVSNLRWASKSEQTLNQGKRKVQRTANKIILVSPNGDRRSYPSACSAADAIGANPGNIANSARHGWRVNGYTAEYDPEEEQGNLTIDGEVEQWKAASNNPNLFVSTMGRIQFRHYTGAMGLKKTPKPNKRLAGYCFVHVGGSDMLVHRLVMETFVGPPPDEHTCTVDHINNVRHDNRLTNLKYASFKDQRLNRSKSKVKFSDLPLAPSNIDRAMRKIHYRRIGMDGVWMVRMAGAKRRWSRTVGVIVEGNLQQAAGLHRKQRHDDLCADKGVDTDVSDVRDDVGYSNEFEEAYLKSGRGRSRRLPAGMYDQGSPSARFRVQQFWE